MRTAFPPDTEAAAFARHELVQWHEKNGRNFPWRDERDPYRVLMAEMMLRRTRANQVVDVYIAFIKEYPDAISLSGASKEQVAEILKPLGLYWRVANFKTLAHELVTRFDGKVPRERSALLGLTGVGPYVADAVRCFAFGEPAPLIDTNTVRVAARYFGFDYNQESRRKPEVIMAVSELLDSGRPEASNYSLLDFAAIVCRALDPNHDNCPLITRCQYFRRLNGTTPEEKEE